MPKIAVAQIEIFDDLDKNVKKVLRFIDLASFKNADLICFPESTLGDFVLDRKSKEIEQVKDKCREKKIYCIVGATIKEKDKIFNSAILINRKGKISYVYKKVHLFPGIDPKEFSSGKENRVIKTDFGKIGIILCWDFAFPEFVKRLSKKGAEIIFCPAYLHEDAEINKEVFRSLFLTRAFENRVYFVVCDAFTDEVLGESYICSPLKVIKEIKNKEGIIFADLDLKEIAKLRKFKWTRD